MIDRTRHRSYNLVYISDNDNWLCHELQPVQDAEMYEEPWGRRRWSVATASSWLVMGPTATSVRRTIWGSQGWRTFEGRMPKLKKTMFIGPCIIVIVEEWKTNLMSVSILFHFLCAQHVSDINISIIRSLRLCCWITTSVVLFSVRCVLEICASACKTSTTQHQPHQILQHTTNWEQDDQCGNSTTQSQAPADGYIIVRNMLST